MKKLYILKPNEDWIVDRFVNEFTTRHPEVVTADILECDTIWLLADWCMDHILDSLLREKKVVTTVHHIVPEKFDREFYNRLAKITNVWHVPNAITKTFVENNIQVHADSKIHVLPYWVNQQVWHKSAKSKKQLRCELGIDENAFVIGSFQRDTEGAGLPNKVLPKLEKGPDLFCNVVESISKFQKNLVVLLGGWRRQYVIERLTKAGIKYHYIERPELSAIKDMYESLDLYVVASRVEGGPQAIVESGAMRVPIMSTRVGLADTILHESSILEVDDCKKYYDSTKQSLLDEKIKNSFRAAQQKENIEFAYNNTSMCFMTDEYMQKYLDFLL